MELQWTPVESINHKKNVHSSGEQQVLFKTLCLQHPDKKKTWASHLFGNGRLQKTVNEPGLWITNLGKSTLWFKVKLAQKTRYFMTVYHHRLESLASPWLCSLWPNEWGLLLKVYWGWPYFFSHPFDQRCYSAVLQKPKEVRASQTQTQPHI